MLSVLLCLICSFTRPASAESWLSNFAVVPFSSPTWILSRCCSCFTFTYSGPSYLMARSFIIVSSSSPLKLLFVIKPLHFKSLWVEAFAAHGAADRLWAGAGHVMSRLTHTTKINFFGGDTTCDVTNVPNYINYKNYTVFESWMRAKLSFHFPEPIEVLFSAVLTVILLSVSNVPSSVTVIDRLQALWFIGK